MDGAEGAPVPARTTGPTPIVLRNVRGPEGLVRDLFIRDGVVTGEAPPPEVVGADLDGWLVLPAPAEPHAHLDKALTWDRLGAGYGDLPAAVASWTEASARITAPDIRERALATLRQLLANGATAVRTHANLCAGSDPLRAVRALVALREELAGRLQVVLLAHHDAPDDVLDAGLALGVDLLGGAPHLAPDPAAAVRRVLGHAARAGIGVDLHVDEQLDPGAQSLLALARAVDATAFAGPVTASHCVSLGVQPPASRDRTVAAVHDAGIAVVALPLTNLYLQGRGWRTSPPRAITAVRALLDAGVVFAAGSDNLRDPFNPMGRGDPLEVASLLVTAAHLTAAEAYAAVSHGARQAMGLPPAGTAPGDTADLLAIRADSLAGAIALAPADRLVFRAGVLVARTTTTRAVYD